MYQSTKPGFGDFLIFVVLSIVTFGIYAAWWQFVRLESLYRESAAWRESR